MRYKFFSSRHMPHDLHEAMHILALTRGEPLWQVFNRTLRMGIKAMWKGHEATLGEWPGRETLEGGSKTEARAKAEKMAARRAAGASAEPAQQG